MKRLTHLARAGTDIPDRIRRPAEDLVRIKVDDEGAPVYVRNDRVIDAKAIIDSIFEADSVVVW